MKSLLTVILCIAFSSTCYADDAGAVAQRIGKNFLEEALSEGGIKIPGEGLGYSGSRGLDLANSVKLRYSEFVGKLRTMPRINLVDEKAITNSAVYREIRAVQPPPGYAQTQALATDILDFRQQQIFGQRLASTSTATVAVIAFASFNGVAGVVFGSEHTTLIRITQQQAAALAKDLGANYLLSIELAPFISRYDPMGAEPGTTELWYRARAYNTTGQITFDDKNPGDSETHILQFVGFRLSFVDRLEMGVSKALLIFPTDAQEMTLTNIEKQLLQETMTEELGKLADRIVKHAD